MAERLVEARALEAWASRFLRAMDAPTDVAAEVARHLVGANLAGHDSHGVLRVPQYKAHADLGMLRPGERPEVVKESACVALIDGRRGFGHVATMQAMEWCLEHAPAGGVAAAAIRRTNHIGRLGEYAERAAAAGMVGIATVGIAGPGAGLMAPFGGRSRFLGTNPWAIGVPAGERAPFVMDFATTNVAEGKIRVARARGEKLKPGLVIDPDGQPTTDPEALYDGGSLTPLGGELAGHKGYGLSLAAALLGTLSMIGDDDPTPAGTMSGLPPEPRWIAGAFVVAIDPEWFGGTEAYQRLLVPVFDAADGAPPAPGRERVLVPGEPEAISRELRLLRGIPIPDATWIELAEASETVGVAMPQTMS